MSNGKKPRQILGANSLKLEKGPNFLVRNDIKNMNWEYPDDNKNLNRSKDPVAMNLENINRIRLEEMASYWPFPQFISTSCTQPTFGLVSPATGVYHQLPYFASSPTLAQTYEISSNGTCSNILPGQICKLNSNTGCMKLDEINVNSPTLNQKKFLELTRLAMRGSETAERIAYTHRNRPCFKKIDSLCARMKQDLIRPDGVLPNINSQGIAWAVKDFIFVFTRVINAWIIIKGYVYNTPEGLNKIKSALSPDFLNSFAIWQDATMDFVDCLVKSFVNLDQLVQNQSVSKKSEIVTKNNSSCEKNENLDESFDIPSLHSDNLLSSESVSVKITPEKNKQSLNKSYYSTLIEDSEESQRIATANGTYFKTGVYNPLMKDPIIEVDSLYHSGRNESLHNLEKDLPLSFDTVNSADDLTWSSNQIAVNSLFHGTGDCKVNKTNINSANFFNNVDPISNSGSEVTVGKECFTSKLDVTSNFQNISSDNAINAKVFDATKNIFNEEASKNCFSYDLKILEKNVSKFSSSFDPTIIKPISHETINKLELLLKRIQNMSEGDLFLEERFIKNYFPEFMSKGPKFLDLRSIFLKAQVGGYAYVNEFVQDLKLIVHSANSYLKVTKDELLQMAINKYEAGINNILKEIITDEDFNFNTDVANKH